MSLRITYSKFIFWFILFFEPMTIALATFAPKLENKLFLLILLCIYIYFMKKIGIHDRGSFLTVNLLIGLFVAWTILNSGLSYVIHLDFYAYVGLGLILFTFSDKEILEEFKEFLGKSSRYVVLSTVLYFTILAISIPLRGGLHTGFNMQIPILYGPYSIPHDVAYECLFLYALNAYMYKREKKGIFFVLKVIALGCVAWTATRSAFVAAVVIVFIDYCGIKGQQKKFLILTVAALGFLYVALFTDFLITNPITQKTLAALRDTGTISNSRSQFSASVLREYTTNTTVIQKILGMGIDGIRATLKADPLVKVAIHAHNDYVNVLCGYGVVGFLILLFQQISLMKIWNKKTIGFMVQGFLFVLLYTNGLAMYTIITPLLPVLFIFSQECCKQVKA